MTCKGAVKIICTVLMAILAVVTCISLVISIKVTIKLREFENNSSDLEYIMESIKEIEYYYSKYYIGEMPEAESLEDSILYGLMLGYDDKYGDYNNKEDSEKDRLDENEQLYGIGVEVVTEHDEGLYIAEVYENSPAEKSGLLVGEYIVGVNGTKYGDVDDSSFVALIGGEIGTHLNLEIKGENGDSRFIDLTRDKVTAKSVRPSVVDGILYVKISSFTHYTDEEFKDAVESYLLEDSETRKIIVDLRDNSGGIADTVISMIDYIIPEGLIAKFKGKDSEFTKEYYSNSSELDCDIAVLVNDKSASASELFAKALQDFGKATIIGENTFGKGTVISTFEMRNGGTITLSTAEYRTKSNEKIEGVGVKPDIEIKMGDEDKAIFYKLPLNDDIQFQAALRLLK